MRFAVVGRIAPSLERGAVVVEGGLVAAVVRDPQAGDLPADVRHASIVSPGFIDLQVNGGFGVEVGDRPEDLRTLAARLPSTGVTAFLPTLTSAPLAAYPRALAAFEAGRHGAGAVPLGLHLEGPFLTAGRAGAHVRHAIADADDALDALDRLLVGDAVRLMTLAPERPGALDRIHRLVERGVVASLGHTDATSAELAAGIDAGATMVTHLYNAMSPFVPRAPGAAGAALVDDRVAVGLIADGVHCDPLALRLAVRAKGVERIALVTDAMSAAGVGPGAYELGGQRVLVDARSARLADGTLAGSILALDQAVRNMVALAGVSAGEALRMATEVPARILGLASKGALAPGHDADLVLLDDDLGVIATYVAGQLAFARTT